MFKSNRLVCINNTKYAGTNACCKLTVGKIYEMSEDNKVVDDFGWYRTFETKRFITINEYRKRKLLKINKNES